MRISPTNHWNVLEDRSFLMVIVELAVGAFFLKRYRLGYLPYIPKKCKMIRILLVGTVFFIFADRCLGDKICLYSGYCLSNDDCVGSSKCLIYNQYYSQCVPDPQVKSTSCVADYHQCNNNTLTCCGSSNCSMTNTNSNTRMCIPPPCKSPTKFTSTSCFENLLSKCHQFVNAWNCWE